jgi:hypothetical protein
LIFASRIEIKTAAARRARTKAGKEIYDTPFRVVVIRASALAAAPANQFSWAPFSFESNRRRRVCERVV